MRKIKAVLYWITLVPPAIDALRGLFRGIKLGLQDLELERLKARAAAEQARFDEANKGE